eukprot:892640-Rhodomonas_salina.1
MRGGLTRGAASAAALHAAVCSCTWSYDSGISLRGPGGSGVLSVASRGSGASRGGRGALVWGSIDCPRLRLPESEGAVARVTRAGEGGPPACDCWSRAAGAPSV